MFLVLIVVKINKSIKSDKISRLLANLTLFREVELKDESEESFHILKNIIADEIQNNLVIQ